MISHYNLNVIQIPTEYLNSDVFYLQVLGASAAKRYGGKLTLLIAVLLWSLSTFITPYFAHSRWALIGLRVLLGIGEGLGMSQYMLSLFCE